MLDNRMSMLHSCQQCPGQDGTLISELIAEEFDDDDDLITYKQWTSTDRTRYWAENS